jgi:hypothetical protein
MYALLGRVVWFVARRVLRRKVAAAPVGQRVAAALAVAALVGGLAALGSRRR